MLKGICPLISPDLLACLRALGHTQEIAFIDANCPVPANHRWVLRADGIALMPLLRAVLQLLPIDEATDDAIFRSTANHDPSLILPVYQEILDLCADMAPGRKVLPLANVQFSERLERSSALVVTGERRLYANVILRKGVIPPDE